MNSFHICNQIWGNKILTNGGPFHQQLEQALCEHLGVPASGAVDEWQRSHLVTALQALRITGEVITTPYSFVATAHSLLWNGITPVFVDVDPATLNIDPARIEAAITPQHDGNPARALLRTSLRRQGNPRIADRYNLKVIYDAAHAFGVQTRNGSVLRTATFRC